MDDSQSKILLNKEENLNNRSLHLIEKFRKYGLRLKCTCIEAMHKNHAKMDILFKNRTFNNFSNDNATLVYTHSALE